MDEAGTGAPGDEREARRVLKTGVQRVSDRVLFYLRVPSGTSIGCSIQCSRPLSRTTTGTTNNHVSIHNYVCIVLGEYKFYDTHERYDR